MRGWITMVFVALVLLAACGNDDDGAEPQTTADTSPTVEETTATTEGTTTTALADEEFPCSLLTQAEVEQLAGNPLEPGDAITNNVTEDTNSFQAAQCDWSSFEGENPVEVTLAVSQDDDFPSGSVECPELPGTTSQLDDIGTQAFWAWNDPGTTLKIGSLRVCTADALVTVDVSSPGDEASTQQIARGVAEAALAAL